MKTTRLARDAARVRCSLLVILVASAILSSGCSRKDGITEPVPVQDTPSLQGNVIAWSTDVPSRGSVRYGTRRGAWDHMAYPNAADREDRALLEQHAIPLLDLRSGGKYYYQLINDIPGGGATIGAIDSFIATTGPVGGQLVSTMVHIGFGDSHLMTMPNGKRILIDSGERDADRALDVFFQDHAVASIDAMVATHVHIDHIGGMVGSFDSGDDGVLASVTPAAFFDSAVKSWSRRAYTEALALLSARGIERVIVNRGDTGQTVAALNVDSSVQITVLSSGRLPNYTPDLDQDNTDINNDSIVLKFSYGDVDFIIGGDAEEAAEASILGAFSAQDLEVEYLKAHHHGLPDANSNAWINTLKPRVSFVPNTDYSFNTPVAGAIAFTASKLNSIGADMYVIDEALPLGRARDERQYNLTFATDGQSYEVRLELATQPAPRKSAHAASCVADVRNQSPIASQTGP